MAETYKYPSFPYLELLFYHPPGNILFYEDFLQRWIKNIAVIENPFPYLDMCYLWRGNTDVLSHKYFSNVHVHKIAYALGHSLDFIQYSKHHRRIHFKDNIFFRCMNKQCIRPDHLVPIWSPHYRNRILPHKRNPTRQRSEWLSMPEANWLQSLTSYGASAPEGHLRKFADHINLPFFTVADIYEGFVKTAERNFYEWGNIRR